MLPAPRSDPRLIGWLSLAQLITWGSVFYTFSLLMEPLERELGLSRAQSSLGFSLALALHSEITSVGGFYAVWPSWCWYCCSCCCTAWATAC